MKLGVIVEHFAEKAWDGDDEGALDVLDREFFTEWDSVLQTLRVGEADKLKRDIRGLVLAAYNHQRQR